MYPPHRAGMILTSRVRQLTRGTLEVAPPVSAVELQKQVRLQHPWAPCWWTRFEVKMRILCLHGKPEGRLQVQLRLRQDTTTEADIWWALHSCLHLSLLNPYCRKSSLVKCRKLLKIFSLQKNSKCLKIFFSKSIGLERKKIVFWTIQGNLPSQLI